MISHCEDRGVSKAMVDELLVQRMQSKMPFSIQRKLSETLHGHMYRKAAIIEVIRRRLRRWNNRETGETERSTTDIAIRNIRVIAKTCKPSVLAAYLRTILNGWVTRRRFRFHSGSSSDFGCCVFGCGIGCDSIEHYTCCQVVNDFFKKSGLSRYSPNVPSFLLISYKQPEDYIKCQARCIYAVYLSHAILKHDRHGDVSNRRVQGLLRTSLARGGGANQKRRAE